MQARILYDYFAIFRITDPLEEAREVVEVKHGIADKGDRRRGGGGARGGGGGGGVADDDIVIVDVICYFL